MFNDIVGWFGFKGLDHPTLSRREQYEIIERDMLLVKEEVDELIRAAEATIENADFSAIESKVFYNQLWKAL